jgi:hypothetical protein
MINTLIILLEISNNPQVLPKLAYKLIKYTSQEIGYYNKNLLAKEFGLPHEYATSQKELEVFASPESTSDCPIARGVKNN